MFNRRGNVHLFQETMEQRPNFEGNRETKTILGSRGHKNTFSSCFGNREKNSVFWYTHGKCTKHENWSELTSFIFYTLYSADSLSTEDKFL